MILESLNYKVQCFCLLSLPGLHNVTLRSKSDQHFQNMPAEGKVFKLSEVKEHNVSKGEAKSIWVVIHDKVYDITKFLDEVSLQSSPVSSLRF